MITSKLPNTIIYIFIFLVYSLSYSNQKIISNTTNQIQPKNFPISKEDSLDQNKLYQQLSTDYLNGKKKNDSLTILKSLVNLSDLDRYRGDYDLAFDKLWESMLLSKNKLYEKESVLIYRNIGILYDIFNKDSLAINYLSKSVDLAKRQSKKDESNLRQLVSSYFSTSMYWRDRDNYELALKYLDSCSTIFTKKQVLPYVLADRGYCYLKLNKLSSAEEYLYLAKKHLLEENSPYQVAVLSFLGDLKIKKFENDSALIYYSNSLKSAEKMKVHMEFKPDLLQKIAEINFTLGNSKKAYEFMKLSKESFNQLFSSTNRNNQRLFEIKNKYKENLLEKELFINKQSQLIKEKNKEKWWLIIFLSLITIIGISIYIVEKQKNRIKKLDLIQKLESKNNTAIIETKSKELTTYSLQLVEKEQTINELLGVIKNQLPKKHSFLNRKYGSSSKHFWDDFNRRFIEINGDFYQKLLKKHSSLSPTEQKHCALIKLNLDSIEMSNLLNISLQSVHTSRYRIKKKIGINQKENLETYIREL